MIAMSTTASTTMYMSIPEGPRIRGRVKAIDNAAGNPHAVHPGRRHPWREMLHFGQPGTGFAECICGAIGVPFEDQS